MKRLVFQVLLLSTSVLFGCGSFRLLGESLEKVESIGGFEVEIVGRPGKPRANIVVVLDVATNKVMNVAIVHGSGKAMLRCLPGRYYIGAFEDTNENLQRDAGEPAKFYGLPKRLDLKAGDLLRGITLKLTAADLKFSGKALQIVEAARKANADAVTPGTRPVTPLSDERFSDENAREGMWDPNAFIEKKHHGLYMLQPYDPQRVPVLFVHGVGGSPRDFKATIAGLDKERFQPWVFYYPSSLRLASLGDYLHRSMEVEVFRQKADKLILVAHSMGGLVATHAVNKYEAGNRNYLKAFVTIASPLAGMASAEIGVEHAPTVMPCWYDLSPNSPFLKGLFPRKASRVPYSLFFAFRNSGKGSGDGTVELTSQLRSEAQSMARRLIGIDGDHMSVLANARTIRELNMICAQHVK